jgi:predicted RNA methylase
MVLLSGTELEVLETSVDFQMPSGEPNQGKTRVLFSRHGVQLDRLGRDEVTPEVFARFTAQQLLWDLRPDLSAAGRTSRVLEVCSGLGGNTIQFALHGASVTAVEIDGARIVKANKNARIYQVPENAISWIEADFLEEPFSGSRFDCVFLSPPWGGKTQMTSFKLLEKQLIVDLFQRACEFADVVAIYLPKSVTIDELVQLAPKSSSFQQLQVERLHFAGKLKATLAIFRRGSSLLPARTDLPLLLTSRSPSTELFWASFRRLGLLGPLTTNFRQQLLRFT